MAVEQNFEDSWKYGVIVASTTNVNTASILPVIDGYQTKRGDRVLLKDQTDATKNGIYVVNSNNLGQDTDSINANSYANGASVRVHGGVTNINTEWYLAPIPTPHAGVAKVWITSPFAGGSSSTSNLDLFGDGILHMFTNGYVNGEVQVHAGIPKIRVHAGQFLQSVQGGTGTFTYGMRKGGAGTGFPTGNSNTDPTAIYLEFDCNELGGQPVEIWVQDSSMVPQTSWSLATIYVADNFGLC